MSKTIYTLSIHGWKKEVIYPALAIFKLLDFTGSHSSGLDVNISKYIFNSILDLMNFNIKLK